MPDLVELVEEFAQQQVVPERVAFAPDQPPVEEVAQQQLAQEQVAQEQVEPVAGQPLVEKVAPPLLQRPLKPIKLMEPLMRPS